MRIQDINDDPLKYGPVVVPLTNCMVDIEDMHDIKHAMLLYLIYIIAAKIQQFRHMLFRGQYLAKNGLYHITFEGVPAQHQPKYFLTKCIISQYKSCLSK